MKEKTAIRLGGLIGIVGLLLLYTVIVPALIISRDNMYNEILQLDSMQTAKIGELVEANNNIISYLRDEAKKGGER